MLRNPRYKDCCTKLEPGLHKGTLTNRRNEKHNILTKPAQKPVNIQIFWVINEYRLSLVSQAEQNHFLHFYFYN